MTRRASRSSTLNKPAKRNAISFAMWRRLGEVFADFRAREDVRVVILTGAGGHFSAGADISEFPELRATPEAAKEYSEAGRHGDAGDPRIAATDDRSRARLLRRRRLRAGARLRPSGGRQDDADGHPGGEARHRLFRARHRESAARERPLARQTRALLRPQLPDGGGARDGVARRGERGRRAGGCASARRRVGGAGAAVAARRQAHAGMLSPPAR